MGAGARVKRRELPYALLQFNYWYPLKLEKHIIGSPPPLRLDLFIFIFPPRARDSSGVQAFPLNMRAVIACAWSVHIHLCITPACIGSGSSLYIIGIAQWALTAGV